MTREQLKIFGEGIRKKREKAGLTMQDVADMAGMYIKSIYNIEKGNCPPKLLTLYLIAQSLDMTLTELLDHI